MTYHTERICEDCLDTYNRLHELDRIRASIRSRRHRTVRNFNVSRENRWATLDMLDNTLSDLNVTARDLRRSHAAHIQDTA